MAAALLRAATGGRGSAEAGLDEDECEDEKEVTERMLLIEPVVKAAVQGSTCSGNARAKRNLAVHALHGQGLFALREACRNPQRAQRGGPRKASGGALSGIWERLASKPPPRWPRVLNGFRTRSRRFGLLRPAVVPDV